MSLPKPYYENELGRLYHADCLDILPHLEPVMSIVTDPPYGVTDNTWDKVVPALDWMKAGCCITTATEPFATELIVSAPLPFRFDCVWVKNCCSNTMNSKRMPIRRHERVLIFGKYSWNSKKIERSVTEMKRLNKVQRQTMQFKNQDTVLEFDSVNCRAIERTKHPSQKPIKLIIYLVDTFTIGTVLDPFLGSGTTAVACERLKRRWIGIEIEEKYCAIAVKRIEAERKQLKLF